MDALSPLLAIEPQPRLDHPQSMAEPESPALAEHLMEAICASDNIEAALRAVGRNKGAPGVDGITVKQLPGMLKARWSEIEDQLLQGRDQPQPVLVRSLKTRLLCMRLGTGRSGATLATCIL
jgi:hypothetical protein